MNFQTGLWYGSAVLLTFTQRRCGNAGLLKWRGVRHQFKLSDPLGLITLKPFGLNTCLMHCMGNATPRGHSRKPRPVKLLMVSKQLLQRSVIYDSFNRS